MSTNVIDLRDWKYGKIARKFMKLRATDPQAAARFARESVKPEEYSVLNEYIRSELARSNTLVEEDNNNE